MKLTLKHFRDITENMPDDSIICVPHNGNEWSCLLSVNCIHLALEKYSYSNDNTITLCQSTDKNLENIEDSVEVKSLIGKNEWEIK